MGFFFDAFLGLLDVAGSSLLGGILGLTAGSLGTILIGGALLVGVAALSKQLAKSKASDPAVLSSGGYSAQPTPQDVQQTLRQAVPQRRRHYGRVKVGGVVAFFNSVAGVFYQLVLIAQGRIRGIEEHWLLDQQVLLGEAPTVGQTTVGSKVGTGGVTVTTTYGLNFAAPKEISYVTIYPTLGVEPAQISQFVYDSAFHTAPGPVTYSGGARYGFALVYQQTAVGGGYFATFARAYTGTIRAQVYGFITGDPEPGGTLLATLDFTNTLAPQIISSPNTTTQFNGIRVKLTIPGLVSLGTNTLGMDDEVATFVSDAVGNSVVSTISGGGLTEDPFTTTNGSGLVAVYHPGHGFSAGALVAFFGLVDDVNGIPLGEFAVDHSVTTVVDGDNYTVTMTSHATSDGGAGGTEVRWRKTNSGADNQYLYANVYRANIYEARGEDEQAASKTLVDAFPTEWGLNHRLAGIAHVLCTFQDVPQADFAAVYPQGIPQYRSVLGGALLFDQRDAEQSADDPGTWAGFDNSALVVQDFLTHADGMSRPRASFDLDSFAAAADRCDETVLLKNGSTEARYRTCTSYDLTEQPAAVLQRLLAACDGHLYPTPEGLWGLRVGVWYPPTVTIESAHVLEYSIEQGSDALTKFNQLKVTYTDPLNDYQETEAEPWEDADSISAYGTISDALRVLEAPSPSQARRLAKIAFAKGNPRWRGTIKTSAAGLAAYGESVVTVNIDELEISETFLVASFEIASDLTYCLMEILSLGSGTYDWDPETEEGTRPATPLSSAPLQVPDVPTNFLVLAAQILLQGSTFGAAAAASWDPPARSSLSHEVQYALHLPAEAEHAWVSTNIVSGAESWLSGVLNDGSTYHFRLRAIGPGGAPSAWTDEQTVVMTADTSAPNPPTALSSSKLGAAVTVQWTNPTSANFYKTTVYRATTNNFALAAAVNTYFGGNGLIKTHTDSGLASATYFYWVRAFNASNVASTVVGSTTQTIP